MQRRQRRNLALLAVGGILFLLAAILVVRLFAGSVYPALSGSNGTSRSSEREADPEYWRGCPPIDARLLTPNEYSRSQLPLREIKSIVIHYTANPGSTAEENRNYFEGLKDGSGTKASSHFIVGLDGEVVQCIPSAEIAYANYPRNGDTLSIECCHPDESGKFNASTRQTVIELSAWLCKAFHVDPDQVIRHYDVSGKECPRYYVEHDEEWETLKREIRVQYESLL